MSAYFNTPISRPSMNGVKCIIFIKKCSLVCCLIFSQCTHTLKVLCRPLYSCFTHEIIQIAIFDKSISFHFNTCAGLFLKVCCNRFIDPIENNNIYGIYLKLIINNSNNLNISL